MSAGRPGDAAAALIAALLASEAEAPLLLPRTMVVGAHPDDETAFAGFRLTRLAGAQFVVTPAMRDELYRRLQSRNVSVPRAVYDSAAPLLTRALGSQIARYVFGPRAEAARSLREDPTLIKALELLQGVDSPKALLEKGRRS